MSQLCSRSQIGEFGPDSFDGDTFMDGAFTDDAWILQHEIYFYCSGSGSRPSAWSMAASSSGSGLGVVSSFSPMNKEFAPATKQSATASRESERRPALNRTIEAGMRMRAVAIVRTKTSGSSASKF